MAHDARLPLACVLLACVVLAPRAVASQSRSLLLSKPCVSTTGELIAALASTSAVDGVIDVKLCFGTLFLNQTVQIGMGPVSVSLPPPQPPAYSCERVTVSLSCGGFAPADWLAVPSSVEPTPCVIDSSGADGPAFLLINACSVASSALKVGIVGVTLRNGFTRTNLNSFGSGGSILGGTTSTGSLALDLVHSIFLNNSAPGTTPLMPTAGQGGAIAFSGLNAVVTSTFTAFISNSAAFGGAVHMQSGSAFYAKASLFASNSAARAGALAFLGSGVSFVEHCTFISNTAAVGSSIGTKLVVATSVASKFVQALSSVNSGDACASSDVVVFKASGTGFIALAQLQPLCPSLSVVVFDTVTQSCTPTLGLDPFYTCDPFGPAPASLPPSTHNQQWWT